MSLMLMKSSKLKSEENTEVAIDHVVTFSACCCRQVPRMPERTEMASASTLPPSPQDGRKTGRSQYIWRNWRPKI
jgi:hypothetical protein